MEANPKSPQVSIAYLLRNSERLLNESSLELIRLNHHARLHAAGIAAARRYLQEAQRFLEHFATESPSPSKTGGAEAVASAKVAPRAAQSETYAAQRNLTA